MVLYTLTLTAANDNSENMRRRKCSVTATVLTVLFILSVFLCHADETSENLNRLFRQGARFISDGNYTSAIECFHKIVVERPRWAEGYLMLSASYAGMGDWSSARRYQSLYERIKNENLAMTGSGVAVQGEAADPLALIPEDEVATEARTVSIKMGHKNEAQDEIYYGTVDASDGSIFVPEFMLTGKILQLHRTPSETSEPVGTVVHGENLEIRGERELFFHVAKTDGTKGWIRKRLVTNVRK